jgi:hypothetical protein
MFVARRAASEGKGGGVGPPMGLEEALNRARLGDQGYPHRLATAGLSGDWRSVM